MLTIKFQTDCVTYTRDCHIPFGNHISYLDKVIEVQADGDELEHIYSNFANIPTPRNTRVVRWFGDMAQFIVHNL